MRIISTNQTLLLHVMQIEQSNGAAEISSLYTSNIKCRIRYINEESIYWVLHTLGKMVYKYSSFILSIHRVTQEGVVYYVQRGIGNMYTPICAHTHPYIGVYRTICVQWTQCVNEYIHKNTYTHAHYRIGTYLHACTYHHKGLHIGRAQCGHWYIHRRI